MKTSLLLLLATGASLLANDTSLHDGRFGPEPLNERDGRESLIRMVAEHIEVQFGYQYTDVHCTFTFRNSTKQAVEETVGFPDIGAALDEMKRRDPKYADTIAERVNTSRIEHLVTRVDGKRVRSELKLGGVGRGGDKEHAAVWSWDGKSGVRAWHVIHVTFPPGKDVVIERTYRVQNGATAAGTAFFHYTTATGGVWKGSIGRLQADVILKDGVTVDGLCWPGAKFQENEIPAEYVTSPGRKAWQVVDARHLRLVWTDFEPTTQENRRGFTLGRRFHGW